MITDDVPPGALGIARERQTNIEGYAERVAAEGAVERADAVVAASYTPRQGERAGYPPRRRAPRSSSSTASGSCSSPAARTPSSRTGSPAKLGVDLGGVTLKTFSNGEVYCRYEESIRGADVFIVQPTCGNPRTGITANDALMELLLMIDAAVGASAHRVIAVTPWYGYSRQDKKSAPREPISARLVARALEAAGADRVLTMDLHAGQIQGFFQKPVDHMTAMFMLTQYFARPAASRTSSSSRRTPAA